jgi:DNA-binding CsgD family transcriptional regulator
MLDDALEGVEYRESLKPLLEQLPAREKKILMLRFFGNMTQSQIAAELGISQMHVSRLLARTLAQLRPGCSSRSSAPARRAGASVRVGVRLAGGRLNSATSTATARTSTGTAAHHTRPCTRPTPTGSMSSWATTAGDRAQPAVRPARGRQQQQHRDEQRHGPPRAGWRCGRTGSPSTPAAP